MHAYFIVDYSPPPPHTHTDTVFMNSAITFKQTCLELLVLAFDKKTVIMTFNFSFALYVKKKEKWYIKVDS